MKKIISILFLFLIGISCYLIYNYTEKKEPYISIIGDINIKSKNSIDKITINNQYTNINYRIKDIYNIIKYNEEIISDNKKISIHQIIKKSDIVILSIGKNDINQYLNNNKIDIYTNINNSINQMEYILKTINRYNPSKVIILGIPNSINNNNDIYTYINYKIKKITKKYHNTYINSNYIDINEEIIKLIVEF